MGIRWEKSAKTVVLVGTIETRSYFFGQVIASAPNNEPLKAGELAVY
jgi:hypothetical protein